LGTNSTSSYGMYIVIVKPAPASLIDKLVANNNEQFWSVETNLQQGDLQYGDRAFTFTTIPDSVAGCDWIRNANGSKGVTTGTVATFTVTEDVYAYLALSTNITVKPDWISTGWEDTGENIVNSETSPKTYRLHHRYYPEGSTVTLGVNGSTSYGMYNIIVKKASQVKVQIGDVIIKKGAKSECTSKTEHNRKRGGGGI